MLGPCRGCRDKAAASNRALQPHPLHFQAGLPSPSCIEQLHTKLTAGFSLPGHVEQKAKQEQIGPLQDAKRFKKEIKDAPPFMVSNFPPQPSASQFHFSSPPSPLSHWGAVMDHLTYRPAQLLRQKPFLAGLHEAKGVFAKGFDLQAP